MEDIWTGAGLLWQYFQLLYQLYKPLVWTGLLGYWLIINYAGYLNFKYDKARAIAGNTRISEAALLGVAFWGGSIGAKIAQRRFRHKTRKEPFRTQLNTICVLHILLIVAGLIWLSGNASAVLDLVS